MSMLNIGVTALRATQSSLATTSHNISNVNTEGYSRQRAEQVTNLPNFQGSHYIGAGVNISSVNRIFNDFLSTQVRSYASQAAQFDTYHEYASQVDEILSSVELGVEAGLESFFAAAQEVSNDPTSVAARQVFLAEAGILANRFNTTDTQLRTFDRQIDEQVTVAIEDVNVISRGIVGLNQAIIEATVAGTTPNDLLDQRDHLINQLSEYLSVAVVPQDNGAVNVFVGSGQALVVGSGQTDLRAISDGGAPPRVTVGYGPAAINISAQLTGGTISGALQVRAEVLDTARAELDALAANIVATVNNIHNDATSPNGAIDLDGNPGGDLFDPAGLTASTMNVLITDPRLIAASSNVNPGQGNNENILDLADLQTDATAGFSQAVAIMVANAATKTHRADIGRATQQGLFDQVKLRFDSVSGVNLDEEAANLIKFQQAYQAASQIITVSNTVFNTLINAL